MLKLRILEQYKETKNEGIEKEFCWIIISRKAQKKGIRQ
jgi:hypothetical protein